MRKHRYTTRRNRSRHKSLSSSNAWPFITLVATVVGILGIVWLTAFVGLPKLLPLIGIDFTVPFAPTPTPAPTPRPTPTPHPMESFDPAEAQHEVVFDGASGYNWFGDPYIHKGVMALTAGKLVEAKAVMLDLYFYDMNATPTSAQKSSITLLNTHFMFPKFNDDWLVYFDAKLDGGGFLMAYDRTSGNAPTVIKQVYAGQPEPMLDGNFIAWTERTGSKMDKLFVCDLTTMETAVIHMFSDNIYGQSKPCLYGGIIIWAGNANNATEEQPISSICSINLNEGVVHFYNPGTYVHDPKTNGVHTAWLDGHHGSYTALYYSQSEGNAEFIDDGVVDFGIGDNFIAYSKNQTIYVFIFANRKIYRVTPERETSQFLGVSDNTVIWMDVTSRERDVVKYVRLP